MRVIYYQNRQVSVPETLEELTPAQYYRYLEIATMANQHILSEPGIRLKIRKHSASCVFFPPLFLPTFVASL